MPSYDYKCRTCEAKVVVVTSIKQPLEVPICSACKAEMVRDYGILAVKFKGKGFYSTGN